MRWLSILSSIVLAVYIVWESARSPAQYGKLKQAIDAGDTKARATFYRSAYWFEWVSAALAVVAFGFDWSRFNPSRLGLDDSSFGRWWHGPFARQDNSFIYGAAIGAVIAVGIGAAAFRLLRRSAQQSPAPARRQSRFFPDFSYLLPSSRHERVLFALVALSAGICEEVVFRAWLLNALHEWPRLEGWGLVLSASILFGLAHYYQGIAGVLVTTVLGLFFCGLYVGSGTLLVPMVVHILVDLRWAVFPSVPGIPAQRST